MAQHYVQIYVFAFWIVVRPMGINEPDRPVAVYLWRRGIRLIIYLYDMLFISSSKDNLTRDFNFIKSLLKVLGFIVNIEKSVGKPTQKIEFLGLVVNSVDLFVTLPKGKVEEVIQLGEEALSKPFIYVGEIAVMLGKFAWQLLPFLLLRHTIGICRLFILPTLRKEI